MCDQPREQTKEDDLARLYAFALMVSVMTGQDINMPLPDGNVIHVSMGKIMDTSPKENEPE